MITVIGLLLAAGITTIGVLTGVGLLETVIAAGSAFTGTVAFLHMAIRYDSRGGTVGPA